MLIEAKKVDHNGVKAIEVQNKLRGYLISSTFKSIVKRPHNIIVS
jgi:hypothetical protein